MPIRAPGGTPSSHNRAATPSASRSRSAYDTRPRPGSTTAGRSSATASDPSPGYAPLMSMGRFAKRPLLRRGGGLSPLILNEVDEQIDRVHVTHADLFGLEGEGEFLLEERDQLQHRQR